MTQPDPRPLNLRESRKEMDAAKKAEAPKPGPRPSNVTPISPAKKAPAKKAAKKTAEKAPAKKAPAKKAADGPITTKVRDRQHPWYVKSYYTPVKGQKLYEATGESGQIAVRSSSAVMTHAVSWAQPGYPNNPAVQQGTIYSMHPNPESAEKTAATLLKGRPDDRTVIVEVREYTGPTSPPKK
jgi:hypothetical protein